MAETAPDSGTNPRSPRSVIEKSPSVVVAPPALSPSAMADESNDSVPDVGVNFVHVHPFKLASRLNWLAVSPGALARSP